MIPALDGFRAYAILGVVAFHILILSAPASEHGGEFGFLVWGLIGGMLDTFFIVSGCALFLPIVARGGLGDVRRWTRKRVARVFPAYWLTLTVVLVLVATTGSAFPSLGEIVVQYSGVQMPARLLNANLPIGFGDAPLWMISVILGLYLVLAVVARPYLRHPLIGLALAAAITVAWKLAAVHMTGFFEGVEGGASPALAMELIVVDQLPGWIYSFALGMTCAWAYVHLAQPRPREQLERLALWVAPLALVAFGICAYLYSSIAIEASGASGGLVARTSPFLGLAFTTARAALLGVIVLGPALLSRPFVNRPVRAFAELSYGVYLIHFIVAVYLATMVLGLPRDGTPATAALWLAVVLPPSIAFAYLALRFVERPARAWAARERPPKLPAPTRPLPRPRHPAPSMPSGEAIQR